MLNFLFIIGNAAAVLFSKCTQSGEFFCNVGDDVKPSPDENALKIIRSDSRNDLTLPDDRKACFVGSLEALGLISSRLSVEINGPTRIYVT